MNSSKPAVTSQSSDRLITAGSQTAKAAELYNLGTHLLTSGQYVNAVKQLRAACKLDPSKARYYENLGIASRHLKHYADSRAALERAAELEPEGWSIYAEMAKVQFAQGDYDAALASFKKSDGLNPPAKEKLAIAKNIKYLESKLHYKKATP